MLWHLVKIFRVRSSDSWDNDTKNDGVPKQQQCNGAILTRPEDDSDDVSSAVPGDLDSNMSTVAELLKKGGRGYGEGGQ